MGLTKGLAKPRQGTGISGRDPSPDELFRRKIDKARQLAMIVSIVGVGASLFLIFLLLFIPAVDAALISPFVAAALAVSACTYASYEVAWRVAEAYSYKLYVRLTSAQPPSTREVSRAVEGTQVLVPVVPAMQASNPPGPLAQQLPRLPRPPSVAAPPTATTVTVQQRHEVVVQPPRPISSIQASQVPPAQSPTCPQCGRELPYGDLHLICPFCGFRLK